jgi:deoxyribodipyrimidine photolyase
MLSPIRQRERFDPDGAYVGRWENGGYPEPMVDLKREAAEAADRFRTAYK